MGFLVSEWPSTRNLQSFAVDGHRRDWPSTATVVGHLRAVPEEVA